MKAAQSATWDILDLSDLLEVTVSVLVRIELTLTLTYVDKPDFSLVALVTCTTRLRTRTVPVAATAIKDYHADVIIANLVM
jgi:hypothetical protein